MRGATIKFKRGSSFLSAFSPLYLDVEITSRYCG